MVVVLKPLHDAATSQDGWWCPPTRRCPARAWRRSRSCGTRSRALLDGKPYRTESVFPHQIAFNCIPQIPQKNAFGANFYTEEEMKMVNETRKIMRRPRRSGSPPPRSACRCVTGHSESVNIETARKLTRDEAIAILQKAPGVDGLDDPANQHLPARDLSPRARTTRLSAASVRTSPSENGARYVDRLGQSAQGRRAERGADRRIVSVT